MDKINKLPPTIPIFPLSNFIIFPNTTVPLNIFEPRYIQMIDDSMKSHRMIGMIQPKKSGELKKPDLYEVGCIGKITSFNETDDGRYLVIINGISRFNINKEIETNKLYRTCEVNYEKYMDLILGPVFFDSTKHPFGVLDTKKFAYNNEEELSLNIELSIKGITKKIDTELTIINLTSDLVQIKGRLEFSRNDFNIGTGNWKNTTILKDNIIIKPNLFLIRD